MNSKSVHICLPVQIKRNSASKSDIDANMITLNNLFVHCSKEIDIKKYRDDLQVLLTNNATDICQYSNAILKHMPKDL